MPCHLLQSNYEIMTKHFAGFQFVIYWRKALIYGKLGDNDEKAID